MSNMTVEVIVIADTHIPERAYDVPLKIKELLLHYSKEADVVVHAGDLVEKDVLDWVKTLAPRSFIVKGNMDYLDLPEMLCFTAENVKVCVVHGHQVRPRGNLDQLSDIAHRLEAKVLISGHTHKPLVKYYKRVLHINPGSLTGVWGGGGGSLKPSFISLVINSNEIRATLYELENENIKSYKYVYVYEL